VNGYSFTPKRRGEEKEKKVRKKLIWKENFNSW